MVQNLTDNFRDLEEKPDTIVDYFIESIQIRLIGCGILETAEERINSFLLPAFLMVYYKSGSVEIQHGGERTVLKPGSLYLFRPYDVYSGRRIGETPLCFTYLQYDVVPFVERYHFGTIAMTAADAVFQDARYRQYGEMLEGLAKDGPEKTGRAAMLRQLVKLFMAQIVYDQSKKDGDSELLKRGRESKVINHAFQYVAEHLSEPIVIGDIWRDGKTSKTSLERAFHNILDKTPQQALLQFKIERSMEMIRQNVPLKNIVKALGFSSVYHFSNTFKSITGIRPTDYRKGIQKEHSIFSC